MRPSTASSFAGDDDAPLLAHLLTPTSPRAAPPATPLPAPFIEKETAEGVRTILRTMGLRRKREWRGALRAPVQDSNARAAAAMALPTVKDVAMDSLDYSLFASAVRLAALRGSSELRWRLRAFKRWLLCLFIGVTVALLATGIIFATRQLLHVKFATMYALIRAEQSSGHADGEGPRALAFSAYAGISVGYVLLAALPVVFIEPLAGGSGIPELKAYLGGVNLPRLLRFKTLIAKLLGLPFALGSGLPIGYEGPMAQIGAAVAAGLSQGKTGALCTPRGAPSATFRSDVEKRDFVSAGAAAGVAAAFNAPAGAVLFVLEEAGATTWHRGLLWRAFLTSVVSSYVIDFVLSGLENGSWGRLTSQGMFSFGAPTDSSKSWSVWDVPFFLLLGACGGFAGALFNTINARLTSFRLARIAPSRRLRMAEAIVVTLLSAAASFYTPTVLGTCAPLPRASSTELIQLYCRDGEFNDLASLWFTPPETAIRTLFTLPTGALSPTHLTAFFLVYTSLMCLASGVSVPAGLFIPSLLAGSALGRLVGELANALAPSGFPIVDAGTYAIIGAASLVGGVTRMSLSMAVILIEATGNVFLALPLIVTLMTAGFVGGGFGKGLYDMQVELRAWPVLEERLPKPIAFSLRVCDAMAEPPVVLREVERVGAVLDTLLNCTHSGFPVVFRARTLAQQPRLGNLAGYIQRRQLAVLLAHRVFHAELPGETHINSSSAVAAATTATAVVDDGKEEGGSSEQRYHSLLPPRRDSNAARGGSTALWASSAPAVGAPQGVRMLSSSGALRRAGSSSGSISALLHTQRGSGGARRDSGGSGVRRSSSGGSFSALLGASADVLHLGGGHHRGRAGSDVGIRLRLPSVSAPHVLMVRADEGGYEGGSAASPVRDVVLSVGSIGSLNSAASPISPPRGGNTKPFFAGAAAMLRRPLSDAPTQEEADVPAPTTPAPRTTAHHALAHRQSASATAGVFYNALAAARNEVPYEAEPALSEADFTLHYPRYPDPRQIHLSAEERRMFVDLRPYFDATPLTVHMHAPIDRAHRLFSAMGLRHLLVTNDAHDCVGVLTRHELVERRLAGLCAGGEGEEEDWELEEEG